MTEYRIKLVTQNAIYDITGRTETRFRITQSEGDKGGGSFSVSAAKGEVIPRPGHIIEVEERRSATTWERTFYGMVGKVSKPSFVKGGSLYKVTTGTPESMLSNRIPHISTIGTVTAIVQELYLGWIKYETGHPEDSTTYEYADIDSIAFSYDLFTCNGESNLYQILDRLCEMHDCHWNIDLVDGEAHFRFKRNGAAGTAYSMDESTQGIAEIKSDGVNDVFNSIRIEDGWIEDATEKSVLLSWQPAQDEEGNDVYLYGIDLPPGDIIYRITRVSVTKPIETGTQLFSWTGGEHVQRIEEAGEAISHDSLFYYTGGSSEGIGVNTDFVADIGSPPKSRTYKWMYLEDHYGTGDIRKVNTRIYYTTCTRYSRVVESPNGMAESSSGRYTGIIERFDDAKDAAFTTYAEGDAYARMQRDYYAEAHDNVTMATDSRFPYRFRLNDRVSADFPHLGIRGEWVVTEVAEQPELVDGECPVIMRTYRLSSKAPELPAKSLQPETRFGDAMRLNKTSGSTGFAGMHDGWKISKSIALYAMHVADTNGTESNNGQAAVPLDRPL